MDNKKKIILPIKVTIVGCIIGLIFAGVGGLKQLNAKKINQQRADEALKQSQKMIDEANARLAEIDKEYNELQAQYDAKKQECDAVTFGSENWFENSSKCNDELFNLESQIAGLEFEDTAIRNKDYTVYYDLVKPMSYYIFYIIGGSIAGIAALAAFIIYLVKGKKTY